MSSGKRNRRKLTASMTVSVALAITVTFMPTISFAMPGESSAATATTEYENIVMNPGGGCVPKDTSFELITPEDEAKNQPAGNASGKKRLLRRLAGQATKANTIWLKTGSFPDGMRDFEASTPRR